MLSVFIAPKERFSKPIGFNSFSSICICYVILSPLTPHFNSIFRWIWMWSAAPFCNWSSLTFRSLTYLQEKRVFLKLLGKFMCFVWECTSLCEVSGVWGSALVPPLPPLVAFCESKTVILFKFFRDVIPLAVTELQPNELGTNSFRMCV